MMTEAMGKGSGLDGLVRRGRVENGVGAGHIHGRVLVKILVDDLDRTAKGAGPGVAGARAVLLGPEPMIGAQRIVLKLDTQTLTVSTDGLGPFIVSADPASSPTP